jgi:HK97 family phage portal protein
MFNTIDSYTDPLLMGDVKAAFSADPYLQASVRTVEGYGSKGAKPRPFNQHAAVRQFGSWIYKATMLNANAVARIPLRLYVKRKSTGTKLFRTSRVEGKRLRYLSGKAFGGGRQLQPSQGVAQKVAEWDGQFEEVTEQHPVLRVLNSVNPWMGGFRLTQLRMIYLQLTGNAYTFKVMDRALGIPSQLWPMPSQYVQIKPSRETFIESYIYGVGTENEKEFMPDEVWQSKLPNPKDLYYGMGIVEAAWTALGLHSSKRVMDQAKFDNMNRPDWFIAFKQAVQPEALTRFESKIDEKFRGPSKSGKFLAIGSDATIQAMNQELQEIGDADRICEEIAAVSGVPVGMLKGNDPSRASAQTADTAWLRDTIRPLALGDEEELNEQYLPSFDVGDDAFLAYDPVSFEDETTIRRNAAAGVSGSLLTVNEGREEIGYGPIDGGEIRYAPSGATGPNASLQGPMAPGQNPDRQNEGNGDKPQNIPTEQVDASTESDAN